MIAIGIVDMKNCSMQKMIPIWLILFGALAIIKNLSTLIQRVKSFRTRGNNGPSVNTDQSHQTSSSTLLNVFDSFMALFLIIWFICGNIWVYTNASRVQHDDSTLVLTYCNALTFKFAFWIITSIYIVLSLACAFFCCTICFTIFLPTYE